MEVSVIAGKTCSLPPRSDYSCGNMTAYLRAIQLDLLHAGYFRPTIERWAVEGCLDEVRRNLGYRYVIREAKLTIDGSRIALRIDNVDWGQSRISHPLYLVANGHRVQKVADLVDFSPGYTNRIHVKLDFSREWKLEMLSLKTDDQIYFFNTTDNLLHIQTPAYQLLPAPH